MNAKKKIGIILIIALAIAGVAYLIYQQFSNTTSDGKHILTEEEKLAQDEKFNSRELTPEQILLQDAKFDARRLSPQDEKFNSRLN